MEIFLIDAIGPFFRGYDAVTGDDLAGVIVSIGESDGYDVQDSIRTQLHLTNARKTRIHDGRGCAF